MNEDPHIMLERDDY